MAWLGDDPLFTYSVEERSKDMPEKQLRFAALIRVSTDKQEKQGESLRTQENQITQAVESLGGVITKRYSGQEHATSGYEREQLDKLLSDASKKRKPFDAVMVFDASRWSRDNAKSKAGLQIFRDNDIRFFTLTQEHNLFDPNAILFLGMSAEIGEYQARQQKQKSVLSCIDRAKRLGAPTSGKKPFGRTWDKEAQKWGVDNEKKAMIQDIAKRYLAGESLPKLATEYGINHSFLNKTLAESCGDSYTITWDIKDLRIHETVTIDIPPLLSAKTIKAIRKKAVANRTHQHGKPKYQYLLQGYVFCKECGYALTGQANHKRVLYYRHRTRARHCECKVTPRPFVRADQLEDAVIRHLFDTFGNPKAVERAIEEATPDLKRRKECLKKIQRLNSDLKSIKKARDSILNLIEKGSLTEEQAETKLAGLQEREELLTTELDRVLTSIENVPTPEDIKATAEEVVRRFAKPKVSARKRLKIREANQFDQMTWEDKRGLIELVFNGTCPDGYPMGIYIEPIKGQENYRQKKWAFTIRGIAPANDDQCVTQCASG